MSTDKHTNVEKINSVFLIVMKSFQESFCVKHLVLLNHVLTPVTTSLVDNSIN